MSACINHSLTNYQAKSDARHIGAVQLIGRTIRLWGSRLSERRALALFDERALRDFGVTRLEADYELSKPFWRG